MTKPIFGLAQDTISHDTVEALQTLLDKAKRGDVIGIAYSVMNKKRTYHVDAAGELHRNPTFAIGTVIVLVYRLVKKAVQ
jgi:hypothetical protein